MRLHRLRLLTIVLALAVFVSLIQAIAAEVNNNPKIYITPPPSKTFPLKIYVYPTALNVDQGKEFTCQHQEEFTLMFYDVLRSFHKVVLRFVDEHPEFYRLLEIRFENVSKPNEADIIFRVIEQEGVIAYTNFTGAWTPYQSQIYVACDLFDRGSKEWVWGVIFHEFGHALGLGHAFQDRTYDGKLELMRGAAEHEKTYPSTLDLYAIHELFFNHSFREVFETATLPKDLEYVMVVPYDVELQQLREENQRLRSDLSDMQVRLDRLNDVINRLTNENKALKQQVSSLKKSVESLEKQLDQTEAVKSNLEQQLAQAQNEISKLQDEVSRLQEDAIALQALNNKLQTQNELLTSENQSLRQQLQQANQMIHALAILAICLTAITLVMITVKRRG